MTMTEQLPIELLPWDQGADDGVAMVFAAVDTNSMFIRIG